MRGSGCATFQERYFKTPTARVDPDSLIRTCLEDLQSEIEAGARKLDSIGTEASEIRQALLDNHFQQAALAGELVRRIADLKSCVAEQRVRMRELRQAVRGRTSITGAAKRRTTS